MPCIRDICVYITLWKHTKNNGCYYVTANNCGAYTAIYARYTPIAHLFSYVAVLYSPAAVVPVPGATALQCNTAHPQRATVGKYCTNTALGIEPEQERHPRQKGQIYRPKCF